MSSRKRRAIRLLATATVATGLALPVSPAVAGSSEPPNPILRNDIAHFGADSVRPAPAPLPAAVVVRVQGGFDWVSAGVGLAAGLGLVLAIGVAASAIRARQRTHEARA